MSQLRDRRSTVLLLRMCRSDESHGRVMRLPTYLNDCSGLTLSISLVLLLSFFVSNIIFLFTTTSMIFCLRSCSSSEIPKFEIIEIISMCWSELEIMQDAVSSPRACIVARSWRFRATTGRRIDCSSSTRLRGAQPRRPCHVRRRRLRHELSGRSSPRRPPH